GSADVNTSVTALWAELSPKGSLSLSDDRMAADLTLSQQTERAAADALGHVQAAQAYAAQADGLPFQFHQPAFIAGDRPALQHLALHSAANQALLAQQDSRALAGARGQLAVSFSAAQNGAGAWQGKSIQPLVDTLTKELAAGS